MFYVFPNCFTVPFGDSKTCHVKQPSYYLIIRHVLYPVSSYCTANSFQDLQDFLDDAEHGVILFTMGFVFETSFVPEERIDALFSVFERLQPQRVVMRLDKVPENTPDNVLIKPFLPQQVSALLSKKCWSKVA